MPDEKPPTTTPKITALDVIKNVGVALLIALFLYWIPLFVDQLYSPTEIRYHRVSLGPLSGYLFSIQNYSRRPIDDLSIFIDTAREIGPVYQDGAVSIEITASSHPAMVKMKTIAPRTEATLFVTLDSALEETQLRISSSGGVTSYEDTKLLRSPLWSPSTFFSSLTTALLYLTLGLYVASQRRHMASEISGLRSEMTRLSEVDHRRREEANKQLEDLKWRMMRARVQMVRLITRLNEEVAVWRRFFSSVYSTMFGSKSDAEQVIELILKQSGIHMVKRLREYSDTEFLQLLEETERGRPPPRTGDESVGAATQAPKTT